MAEPVGKERSYQQSPSFFHLPALEIIITPYAIVLGMVYDFLPFMILPIYNVLSKIDTNVIEAARDLGANSVQTFTKILLPLSVPGSSAELPWSLYRH